MDQSTTGSALKRKANFCATNPTHATLDEPAAVTQSVSTNWFEDIAHIAEQIGREKK
jgi:hypothetical protein